MNKTILLLTFLLLTINLSAQEKYFTKEGYITFYSHSLVEDIKAENHQVLSIIDESDGQIAIQLLMRSFIFKKALMQEHFNENYIESHKYPKATFKGIIENFSDIAIGESDINIKGTLNIHGKQKEINTRARINKTPEELDISGNFIVKVADFDIKIPAVVINNIAKNIKISFDLKHKPYKK